MSDTERMAHAVVAHMPITMKTRFRDFVTRGRLSKEAQGDFTSRDLIHFDEYGSPKLTDLGRAAMKLIEEGV